MRFGPVMLGVCAVLVCGCTARPSTPKSQAANVATSTPLILEKNEGERRVLRGCLDILSRERLSLSRSIQRMADPRIWSFSQEISRPEEQSTHIATQALTKFSFCKAEPLECTWETRLETFTLARPCSSQPIHGSPSITLEVTISAWEPSFPRRASRSLCGPDPFTKGRKTSR